MTKPNRAILKKPMKILLFIAAVLALVEVLCLMFLYLQIPQYKNYWNNHNKATAPDGALTYVALGDSTAQGIGASRPDKGYVGLIAKALEQKTGKPIKVINLSVSGARLADCLQNQLPELANYKADFVTIEIGANDMNNYNQANFQRDMEQLISRLPKNAVISDLPYFGGGRKRNLEANVESASKIIQELAKSHGLKIAQLHQVTKDNDNILTMSPDLLHPSNRSYRNWYKAFAEPLDL